jgi:hypothetical protein
VATTTSSAEKRSIFHLTTGTVTQFFLGTPEKQLHNHRSTIMNLLHNQENFFGPK